MDVILLMPDELLSHLLLDWFDLATIARLDSAYVSHRSRTKFLSHISNTNFVHNGCSVSSVDGPVTKQVRLVQWLVHRECRVRRVCLSVELQQYDDLLTEFFRISGTSLHRIEIQNKSSDTAGDLLWGLLLEHCHNLQGFCIKERFPDNPDFLHELSLRCPSINELVLSLHDGHTIAITPHLRFNQLRFLQLTGAVLSGPLLAAIAPGSPRLEELFLFQAIDIKAEHFAAIAVHCPLLHTVLLSDQFIGDEELQPMFTSCKNLRTLKVFHPSWNDFTDLSLSHIAQNCSQLGVLRLQTCLRITDNGLCDIFKYCRNLRDLTLRGNIRLIDATLCSIAAFCPLLTHLNLRGRFGYSNESLSAIAQSCSQLQQLLISTGRRQVKETFPDVFDSHVEVVITVERGIRYKEEVSDEEHAQRAVGLGMIGLGDY